MLVKLNRDLLVGATDHQPGEVVEVPEDRARDIVAKGDGIAVDRDGRPIATPAAVPVVAPRVVPPPELTGEVLPVEPREGEVVRRVGAAETRYVTKIDGRTAEVAPDGRVS